ncbi:hypothetical protein IL252_10925 [Halomicrobium sp. IBSBa]|uniref:hypothetical protein n=1 Tax=Halomicrobium sp. IBSBa TaxID=2778916 RepID=UPI001ABF5AC3|nr:hypothetical protein [Halomicrobium sp. IBSBa]MBO4248326.1 hypothetical protein [Halomicrobium sp. IBSBa]
MNRRAALSVVLSIVGLAAVVVGIYQELLHFRPMYDATVHTAWDGRISHEERLLSRVAVVGVLGVLASFRWRRAALGAVAASAVVFFYAARAVGHYAAEGSLYTGFSVAGGDAGRFVLGAEPYWLVLGAACLLAGGVVRLYTGRSRTANTTVPADADASIS